MEIVLIVVTFALFGARERLGHRLSALAHRRLILTSTGAVAVCAVAGIVGNFILGSRVYFPLLVLPVILLGLIASSLVRGKNGSLNMQLAPPDKFERMRADMQVGFDLGFTTARVETAQVGNKELLLLSMVGHNNTLYTAQVVGKKHAVAFSTFFDEGRYDLTTHRFYERMAPRSIIRVVAGTPAEMLASHQVDVASLEAAGHRAMTSATRDLVEVSGAMLSTHQLDMAREWLKTLWRVFVPPRSVMYPVVPANI